jgi:hypothetical protein
MKKSFIVLCLIIITGQVYSQSVPANPSPTFMRPTPASAEYKAMKQKSVKSTDEPTGKSFYQSRSDWQVIIDTTWGLGLPLAEKLKIFDTYTGELTGKFDGFYSLGITPEEWTQTVTGYRNQIDNTTSRGAFSALMSRLAFGLSDLHTYAYDDIVINSPLNPGTPILVTRATSVEHFGAVLTPLPDSNLVVLRTLENHPLDLQPGDIVLGYEGVPWKDLSQELFESGLPVFGRSSGASSATRHNLLSCAGLNWHLFNTIDILKYNSKDTLHLSVLPLLNLPVSSSTQYGFFDCEDCMLNNEQLPVPGITLPEVDHFAERSVNYGRIEGTNIGYIYLYIEIGNSQIFNDFNYLTDPQFLEAGESLWDPESLIIDLRINLGGYALLNDALSLLFNYTTDSVRILQRCNTNDFNLCEGYDYESRDFWRISGDPATNYDKPIAVLIGPNCVSMGDITTYRLAYHPMVKFFGKPICATPSANLRIELYSDWSLRYSLTDYHEIGRPEALFNRSEFPVDEPVWFNADDVAAGEDPIVNSALQWIQNLSFAHDVNPKYKALPPGYEYQQITTLVENPNNHELEISAKIANSDGTISQSLDMLDDGQHGDGEADDGIWGFTDTRVDEGTWNVNITTKDIEAGKSWTLDKAASYHTIGPLETDHLSIVGMDTLLNPGDTVLMNLGLANRGKLESAFNVEVSLSCLDPFATIDTGMLSIPNINPGTVKTYRGNIHLVISENCPVDYEIPVKIDIYSYGNAFWSDTLKIMVQQPLNTGQSDIQNIRVYPNPAKDRLHIDIADNGQQKTLFELYDIFGRLLFKQTLSKSQILDISHLKTGMYLYRLQNGSDKRSGKLIKK